MPKIVFERRKFTDDGCGISEGQKKKTAAAETPLFYSYFSLLPPLISAHFFALQILLRTRPRLCGFSPECKRAILARIDRHSLSAVFIPFSFLFARNSQKIFRGAQKISLYCVASCVFESLDRYFFAAEKKWLRPPISQFLAAAAFDRRKGIFFYFLLLFLQGKKKVFLTVPERKRRRENRSSSDRRKISQDFLPRFRP